MLRCMFRNIVWQKNTCADPEMFVRKEREGGGGGGGGTLTFFYHYLSL